MAQASAAANITGATLTAAVTAPLAAFGGGAILAAYGEGTLGTGVLGGAIFTLANSGVGIGYGVTNSIANQLMNSGTIDWVAVKNSAELGAALGIASGYLGVLSETNALSSAGRISDLINKGEDAEVLQTIWAQDGSAWLGSTSNVDFIVSQIQQEAANACLQNTLFELREALFPAVEYSIDQWIDTVREHNQEGNSLSNIADNSGSGVPNVTVQQDPTGKYPKPVSSY